MLDSTVPDRTLQETMTYTFGQSPTHGSGQAWDDDVVDQGLHGVPGHRPAGDDGPEDQVVRQQIPKFVVDCGLVDLTAANGLLEDLVHQGLPLLDELVLHDVVECGVARYLDEHRADGAGVLLALLADQFSQAQQVASQCAGFGWDGDL